MSTSILITGAPATIPYLAAPSKDSQFGSGYSGAVPSPTWNTRSRRQGTSQLAMPLERQLSAKQVSVRQLTARWSPCSLKLQTNREHTAPRSSADNESRPGEKSRARHWASADRPTDPKTRPTHHERRAHGPKVIRSPAATEPASRSRLGSVRSRTHPTQRCAPEV